MAFLFTMLGSLQAQVSVKASTSEHRVGRGEALDLIVDVEGPGAMGAEMAEAPSSSDFRMVAPPSVSTQIQIINGSMTRRKSFRFLFVPNREGKLQLPSVKVLVEGKVYQTRPVPVEVTGQAPSRPQQAPDPMDPFADPFGNPDPSGRGTQISSGDVQLRLEASPHQVFVGQPVAVELVLYYRIPVVGGELDREGKVEGFWSEDVPMPSKDGWPDEIRRLDGKEYHARPVRRWVLFPTRPGTFTLDPWSLKLTIQTGGGFFFGPVRQDLVRRSNPVTLTVSDFPLANRPARFDWLCGSYSFQARPDKSRIAAGEGLTFRVTVSGKGNLRTASPPSLPDLPGCKVYKPKVADDLRVTGTNVEGSRTWEYVLVPLQEGTLHLPSLTLCWFDPEAREYRSASTSPQDVTVLPGQTGSAYSTDAQAPVPGKTRELLPPVSLSEALRPPSVKMWKSPWYGGTLVVLVLGLGLWGAFELVRHRRERNGAAWARSQAGLHARRGLRECGSAARSGDSLRFCALLQGLLQDYLMNRFGIPRVAQTGSGLQEALAHHGVPDDVTRRVVDLMRDCEAARFSPNPGSGALEGRLEDARSLLERLEEVKL